MRDFLLYPIAEDVGRGIDTTFVDRLLLFFCLAILQQKLNTSPFNFALAVGSNGCVPNMPP